VKPTSESYRVQPYEQITQRRGSFGYAADWSDSRHHYRRLASEFIGTYGFVFALAGGAGAFHTYATPALSNTATVVLLTMIAAMACDRDLRAR